MTDLASLELNKEHELSVTNSSFSDSVLHAKRLKVSVAMITYNHAEFIRQALDSVLMQVTTFDYEIVIGDDLSTDSTRQILLEYQAKHPERFRLLLYDTKQGVGGNILQVLYHCRGEYIALLEGDDYWTDPNKLQLQADWLDNAPQCSLCFHNYQIYSQIDGSFSNSIAGEDEEYKLYDLIEQKFYPATHTNMFRRSAVCLPEWVRDLWNIDDVIAMLCAQRGTMYRINRLMSVYRVHQGGIYSGSRRSVAILNTIKTREAMLSNFNHYYLTRYKFYDLRPMYLKAIYYLVAEGNEAQAHRCLFKVITLTRPSLYHLKQLVIAIMMIYLTPLYHFWMRRKHASNSAAT